MKQACRNCGEELLGEVNRCWKCGTEITPVILALVLPEKPPLAVSVPIGSGGEAATAAMLLPDAAVEMPAAPSAAAAMHRPVMSPPARDTLLSGVAAVLAALLGAGSVYLSFYSHWGLVLASLGIVLAAWGTFSRLRGLALLALLLCTLGVGIACYNLAVEVYRVRTGVHPFSPNTPVE